MLMFIEMEVCYLKCNLQFELMKKDGKCLFSPEDGTKAQ